MRSKKTLSLLGALELDQLHLGDMCESDSNFKFLNIVTDGLSVNKLAAKMMTFSGVGQVCYTIANIFEKQKVMGQTHSTVTAELSVFDALIVFFSVCAAHTLSNEPVGAVVLFSSYSSYYIHPSTIQTHQPTLGPRKDCVKILRMDAFCGFATCGQISHVSYTN